MLLLFNAGLSLHVLVAGGYRTLHLWVRIFEGQVGERLNLGKIKLLLGRTSDWPVRN